MRRVVVTGLGIVSSIGNNKDEVLASLKAGRSGVEFCETYAEMGFRSHVHGSIDIDLNDHIDRSRPVGIEEERDRSLALPLQMAITDDAEQTGERSAHIHCQFAHKGLDSIRINTGRHSDDSDLRVAYINRLVLGENGTRFEASREWLYCVHHSARDCVQRCGRVGSGLDHATRGAQWVLDH